jgi:hypothetical protein
MTPVRRLFRKGWKHARKFRPRVHAIFKIVRPQMVHNPYWKYQSAIANIVTESPTGNEYLLFHGTTRACLLGEDSQNILLCRLPECSLCHIIRGSFSIKKCGRSLPSLPRSYPVSCTQGPSTSSRGEFLLVIQDDLFNEMSVVDLALGYIPHRVLLVRCGLTHLHPFLMCLP